MAELNSAELGRRIRSGETDKLYYIYGSDVSAVEAATRAVLKKLLGQDWETSVTRFDGKNMNISEFEDAAEMNMLFSDSNVLWINDLNADELRQDEFDTFFQAVRSIPEQTVLIINITGFDVKNGKKSFSGKNKKLTDHFLKNGVLCCCAKKTAAELSKLIAALAQKNGCSVSRSNAELIASMCLFDTLRVENEMAKLCAYCEKREIERADIELLVSGQIETDSFRLAENIIAKNSSAAFVVLDELLSRYDSPIAILSAVSMSFLDLYRAKAALSSGRQTGDVAEDFSYGARRFAVDKAFRNCRRTSEENIRKCMSIMRKADRRLKRSSDSAYLNTEMEKMLTELLITVKNG